MRVRGRSPIHRGAILLAILVAALALVGCGGGEPSNQPSAQPATTRAPSTTGSTTVAVTLQEFSVTPAQASAPAGQVTFQAKNTGPEDEHELVVIKTDRDPGDLPTKSDGSVNEEGAGLDAVGEIEEFKAGTTQSKAFDLAPGSYVLICNVVEKDKGKTEAHYHLGMRTAFTVG